MTCEPRHPLLWPGLAVLFLGLAPMGAEPHIVGKLRWVWGGAVGMGAMDWFDLLMHGAPWVWLLFTLIQLALPKSPSGPMVSTQSIVKLNQAGAHRSANGSKESS